MCSGHACAYWGPILEFVRITLDSKRAAAGTKPVAVAEGPQFGSGGQSMTFSVKHSTQHR